MDEPQNGMQIPEEMKLFLESCLWDKGMRDLPEEMKTEMIRNLAVRLQTWLLQSALAKLKDSDISEFDKLTEQSPDPAIIQSFLREKIPNIDEVFGNAMLTFKQTYLEG